MWSVQAKESLQRVVPTHVSLPIPEGFIRSPHHNRLEAPAWDASIDVVEMEHSFEEKALTMTAQHLSAKGMVLLSREPVVLGEHSGVLVQVSQLHRGQTLLKWILLLGDTNKTVEIMAMYPQSYDKELSSVLRHTLLRCQWKP